MTREVEEELSEQIAIQREWAAMTPEQKKKRLFQRQEETLGLLFERNAISRAQYDHSLGVLRAAFQRG